MEPPKATEATRIAEKGNGVGKCVCELVCPAKRTLDPTLCPAPNLLLFAFLSTKPSSSSPFPSPLFAPASVSLLVVCNVPKLPPVLIYSLSLSFLPTPLIINSQYNVRNSVISCHYTHRVHRCQNRVKTLFISPSSPNRQSAMRVCSLSRRDASFANVHV